MEQISSSMEDYLEAIWDLAQDSPAVRVKDIGKMLDVTSPSVVGAVKALSERGLVTHERYGYVELTERGEEIAREVYGKHNTLAEFFKTILGVDPDTAERDACAAEHALSDSTLNRIKLFTRFVRAPCSKKSSRLGGFQSYVKRNLKSGTV
jgi:Mn-dependent DtxR family transcriptional regulator